MKTCENLRREIDILNQDKTYLSRENSTLMDRNKRLEDKADKLEGEISGAKEQSQKYLEQLLQTKDDYQHKFTSKFDTEI